MREPSRGAGQPAGSRVAANLQSSAVLASRLKLPKKIGSDLNRLKEAWKKIPDLEQEESKAVEKGEEAVEKARLINTQLAAVRQLRKKGKPSPSSLAEVLIRNTFT